jgi:glycosyltransferase involved in cell wall biosynthesis
MLRDHSELTIVIPCYNEAKRLPTDGIFRFLQKRQGVSLRFVNDGSIDATANVLQQLATTFPSRITASTLTQNQGKAEAVRRGVLDALEAFPACDFIGYWDADLATPLSAIDDFLGVFEAQPTLQWVSGARIRRGGSNIQRSASRHYLGRCLATLVSLHFGIEFYDTQCGAKLLRRELAQQLFKGRFVSRWLFDVELILRLQRLHASPKGLNQEFPLSEWIHVGASKVKPLTYLQAIGEFIRIATHYR